jgi:hypothetical protein
MEAQMIYKFKRLAFLALTLSCFPHATAALPGSIDEVSIRNAAIASFPEYLELLSLPNDSIQPADIQRNADWLEKAFQRRGFRVQQLANMVNPSSMRNTA